jgi:N6-adenosine-specific RNA methylase IME4
MMRAWQGKTGGKNNVSTLLQAELGAHSVKPEAAYKLIEAASPGPRLEIFARTTRRGWTAWGQ